MLAEVTNVGLLNALYSRLLPELLIPSSASDWSVALSITQLPIPALPIPGNEVNPIAYIIDYLLFCRSCFCCSKI